MGRWIYFAFFTRFFVIFAFFLDIFLLMLKRSVSHRKWANAVLTVLGLSAVLLAGCKSDNPAPSPIPVKLSSSSQMASSSSVEETVIDTTVSDTAIADTLPADTSVLTPATKESVVSSSFLNASSSSVQQSSSSEVVVQSSSSEVVVDSVAPVIMDSSNQEVVLEELPQEVAPDTVKDTVAAVETQEDTSLCANVPATVLCDKRDGQLYRTIHIGSQVWMAQNLNYAVASSWCYRNSLENCSNYGRLYHWTAAMNLDKAYSHSSAGNLIEEKHQGVCPEGWYVPKDSDMETLVSYVKESNKASGLATEEVGTSLRKETGWEENDEEILGTNRYGFAAIPAGYRDANGAFAFLGEEADFWVAEEESNGTQASHWSLYYANQTFSGEFRNLKTFAFSIRCLKK